MDVPIGGSGPHGTSPQTLPYDADSGPAAVVNDGDYARMMVGRRSDTSSSIDIMRVHSTGVWMSVL